MLEWCLRSSFYWIYLVSPLAVAHTLVAVVLSWSHIRLLESSILVVPCFPGFLRDSRLGVQFLRHSPFSSLIPREAPWYSFCTGHFLSQFLCASHSLSFTITLPLFTWPASGFVLENEIDHWRMCFASFLYCRFGQYIYTIFIEYNTPVNCHRYITIIICIKHTHDKTNISLIYLYVLNFYSKFITWVIHFFKGELEIIVFH